MKPPSTVTTLFGNPVSALALMLGALFVGYLWLTGEASGWAAFFAAIAASYAARASEQVNAYGAWKREWNAMSGMPSGLRLPRLGGVRYLLGIGAWLFMALLAIGSADDPTLQVPVALFWLATAIIAVVGIRRLLGKGGQRASARNVMVQVCPSRPLRSPSANEAFGALPEYCRALLG